MSSINQIQVPNQQSQLELELSVLSYNVNFACARDRVARATERNIIGAIRSADADLVLLQETHAPWHALLRDQLDYPFEFFHDESLASSGGVSIFSRHPLLELHVTQTPQTVTGSWFPIVTALIDSPIGTIACR